MVEWSIALAWKARGRRKSARRFESSLIRQFSKIMIEHLSVFPEGVEVITWPKHEVEALNERILVALEKADSERREARARYNATLPTHLRRLG